LEVKAEDKRERDKNHARETKIIQNHPKPSKSFMISEEE